MWNACKIMLLILFLASCKKDEVRYRERDSYYQNLVKDQAYPDSLRVMTYNIQLGFAGDRDPWDRANTGATPDYLNLMTSFLRSTGADVIALQEVPLDRSNTAIKRILDSLGHRLRMNYAFGSRGYNEVGGAGKSISGQWGNAILSRYPIVEIENREIAYTDVWSRRSSLRVRIMLDAGKLIDVYSIHHSTSTPYDDLQKTADFVHESSLPKIVCGDFNSTPDSPMVLLRLLPAWDIREMGIDQIYNSPEFAPLAAEHYPGVHLSDHPPISVRLRF